MQTDSPALSIPGSPLGSSTPLYNTYEIEIMSEVLDVYEDDGDTRQPVTVEALCDHTKLAVCTNPTDTTTDTDTSTGSGQQTTKRAPQRSGSAFAMLRAHGTANTHAHSRQPRHESAAPPGHMLRSRRTCSTKATSCSPRGSGCSGVSCAPW